MNRPTSKAEVMEQHKNGKINDVQRDHYLKLVDPNVRLLTNAEVREALAQNPLFRFAN